MKKITLILITLLMLTCFSSAANYDLKKTIGGVSVITTIPEGTNVTLKYIKNGNFTRWEIKQGGITLSDATNKTVTFTMPARAVEIEAIEMAEPTTQPLTICTDGQISETIQMTVGESVTLTPVEGNGKTFASWQITGLTGANAASNPLTFTMPNNAVEIIATFIVHTHSYSEATCTTPPTCSCGATNGAALGHSWNNATCTAPKTCSVCGATEGNALGHSWNNATCTVAKTCSRCSATEGAALGHSYTGTRTCNANGSTDKVQCIRCSATENQTCTHTYTISKSAGTGGSVTLSATSVKAGGSITVTITPSSGYEINTIAVNGASVTVSNKAGMTHTISGITSNQTVTATFTKKVVIANNAVPVGAYIEYVPTATSAKVYETDSGDYNEDGDTLDYQEFNPRATTSWRVMYNNAGQLDIVSADAVYRTDGDYLYLYGKTGYAKAVDTLNNLCNQFVNTTYATSGRSIGCTSESVGTIAESAIYDGVTGAPYTDELYSTDVNQLKSNNLLHSSGFACLASRCHHSSYFGLWFLESDGNVRNDWALYIEDDGYTYEFSNMYGVRPVVSLSSDIKITGGSGIAGDPYKIATASGCAHNFSRVCNVNGSNDTIQCSNCSYTETKPCTHQIKFTYYKDWNFTTYSIYTALAGMTWEQWVNSTYNTVGATINEYSCIIFNTSDTSATLYTAELDSQDKDSVIIEGGAYISSNES